MRKRNAKSTPATLSLHTNDGLQPSHTLAALICAGALGAAIQNGNGMLYNQAINWLVVAVIAAPMGMLLSRWQAIQAWCRKATVWALLAAALYAFHMWPFTRPALYVQAHSPTAQNVYMYALSAAAIFTGASFSPPTFLRRSLIFCLLGTYVVLGIWLIQGSPQPRVDVVTLHQEALTALLHGNNPFAITFPDIYPGLGHYPEGLVKDGRVLFGYDYPPLNLLMALPVYIFADYRYALLFANIASAWLMFALRPRNLPLDGPRDDWTLAVIAMFLFTPRALLILENGWTEPFAVFWLMGTLWTAQHRPAWLPYALGLLLASKQYVVLLMGAAYQLPIVDQLQHDPKQCYRFVGKTLTATLIVTLPFFLWSPSAFWHSVVEVPIAHPFREDALNFLAWYKQTYGVLLPTFLGFAAALLMSVLSWLLVPRCSAGFAYSFASIFLFFVAFNRQAFCNYYFLIIAAFCAVGALAAKQAPSKQT